MKAKEYAYRIIRSIQLPSTEFDKVIYSVVQDLFAEVLTITKARKCACNSAYCAVFDEIDNKWITVCRIVNEQCNYSILNKTGFRELAFHIADKAGMWQIRMVWKPKKIN